MIEFECSQCGNRFRVGEDLAGRHGWCRVCKALIVVPTADAKLPFNKLPAELRVKTLEKLLRHAGIRYEQDRKIMDKLQQRLEQADKAKAVHDETTAALSALEARLDDSQQLVSSLSEDLKRDAESRGRTEEALRQSERRIEELSRDNERLGLENREYQQSLDERNTSNARLKEELASLATGDEGAQQSKFVELGDALSKLEEDLNQARARHRELEHDKAGLEKRIDAVEKESAHHREEAERLRVMAAQANESERDHVALQARYDEASKSVEDLTGRLAETSDKLGRAEAEVSHLEEERKQLRQALVNAKEEVDTFESRIAELTLFREQNERVRAEADENRAARLRLEDAVKSLEDELAATREESESRLRAAAAASGEDAAKTVAELQAAEAAARNEAADLRRRADDGERQLARLKEEHEALRERASDAAKAQDAIRLIEARLEEAHGQVDKLTRRLADQAKSLALAEAEAQRLRSGAPSEDREESEPAGSGSANGSSRGFGAMADEGRGSAETFVPELLDDDTEADDALMDALLRFIGQQS